jgi:hypothetical protein
MVTATAVSTVATEDVAGISERVTSEERAARWGQRGAVLELNGPADIINTIERSLFAAGAITSRIETGDGIFKTHAGLLDLLIQSHVQSGVIALAISENDSPALTARVEDRQLTLHSSDPASAITAVHKLLMQSGVLYVSGKANAQ